MFTGCIKATGTVVAREDVGGQVKLWLSAPPLSGVGEGSSIAVNGVCLTVERLGGDRQALEFTMLSETVGRTNLGILEPGSIVNLESAAHVGEPLDGHWVTGHVDCTSRLLSRTTKGDDVVLEIPFLPEDGMLLVPKGSIAVDGVSLTIARLAESAFFVHVIPFTLAHTNLSEAKAGTLVNLEFDILGKYAARFLKQQSVERRVL